MTSRYTLIPILVFLMALPMLAQKSVYDFPFENTYRLPSMQAYINMEEISASYQTIGNIFTTEVIGMEEEAIEQTSMSYISDVKAIDAVRFLKFYLEDQLIAPGDGSSGLVELSIIYQHERNRANIGSAIGVLTFGLATLFGVPYATTIIDLETEAQFYDPDDYLVATHRGVGRGKKLQTLYNPSTRRVHQRALKNSLKNLNSQIMNDPVLVKTSPVTGLNPKQMD